MTAFSPIATIPVAALEDETAGTLAFQQAAEATAADTVYLVTVAAYRPSTSTGSWVLPIATTAIAALADGEESEASNATLYYSDRGWVSGPADTLANRPFDGRADNPLTVDRATMLDPLGDRRLAVNVGGVSLLNGDGALDAVVRDYAVDGRAVSVRFGKRSDAYANFGLVFTGVGVAWEGGTTIGLILRELGYQLETALQTTLYGGTGGADGDSAIAGQPKPILYGKRRNITPRLINSASLVYQFHDGAGQAVDAVRDQGIAITLDTSVGTGGDVASYAALAAATIAAGKYATCLALGLFRVNSNPAGQLTADVRGDATGTYVDCTADVVKRILTGRAGLTLAALDRGAFSALAGTVPGTMGIYIDQPTTIADAISAVMAGIAGYWGGTRAGLITVGRLTSPGLAGRRFDTMNIVREPQRQRIPANVDPSCWRVTVNYRPNSTVQQGGDLLTTVAAADRDFYGKPSRPSTPSSSAARITTNATARDLTTESLFENAADAAALAADLFALYAPGRMLLDITVKTVGHLVELGSVVTVYWPRYGLADGLNMLVVAIHEDCARREVTLTLFG